MFEGMLGFDTRSGAIGFFVGVIVLVVVGVVIVAALGSDFWDKEIANKQCPRCTSWKGVSKLSVVWLVTVLAVVLAWSGLLFIDWAYCFWHPWWQSAPAPETIYRWLSILTPVTLFVAIVCSFVEELKYSFRCTLCHYGWQIKSPLEQLRTENATMKTKIQASNKKLKKLVKQSKQRHKS